MIMKGRSQGKTTANLDPIAVGALDRMASDLAASLGNDVSHLVGHLISSDADGKITAQPIDAADYYGASPAIPAFEGAANLDAARAEYELSAKREAFFFAIRRQAEADIAALFNLPALMRSALFRTTSDHAILCAWGWQLQAQF